MVRGPPCKVSKFYLPPSGFVRSQKWPNYGTNCILRPERSILVRARESQPTLASGRLKWLNEAMLLCPSESDIPAIVDLVNRAYRGWGEQRSWTVEDFIAEPRVDEAEIRQDLADPSVRLRIVRDEASGTPIATVRLQDEGAGLWQLGMLSVDPARQKDGLGQRIMAAAEEAARGEGASRMRLYVVHRRPELLAWYGRRGYWPTGETRPFPGQEDAAGADARNDLHFLLLEKSL